MRSRKFLLLIPALALVVCFRALGLGSYLTLDYLRMSEGMIRDFDSREPLLTLLVFMGTYIAVTALSFPGATLLTLAAGAVFGFWKGTLVVSFASTIGATLAFLLARFFFRDWVQARFPDRLKVMDDGIRKEGAFYLFALRLLPVIPFFMVNLLMGITALPVRTFYWVSQVGMLAATLAYVNAGTQLGELHSLRGILSPGILMSLAALAVLPFAAKKALEWRRVRRIYSRFKTPSRFDYNMVVIGGGSAGLVSAYIAAVVKSKVALIEKNQMGGDCLNTGCVPSKALIRSARVLSDAQRAREFGFKSAQVDFDFVEVMARVQAVIRKVAPHDSVERYTAMGVECIAGEAKLLSPYEVQVNGRTLTTRNIVVATGASPWVPPIAGVEKVRYLTSETIWELKALPRRFLVLGGGAIGSELAQCFARFGSQVTIVEQAATLLGREDAEVSSHVAARFRAEGMNVLLGHRAIRFESDGAAKVLVCEADGVEVRVEFDEILLALGRRANVRGFGLEELGVELLPNGTIRADEYLRTNYPNIFVCGDVTGPFQFTHAAAHQAWYVAVNALFGIFRKYKADYRVIPWATFTDPEVARVGLNEREAREKGIAVEVTRYELDDLDRAIADSEDHGFVKVLTVPGRDRILGATIVGAHASDIIVEYVTAMKYHLGMNKILGTVHLYPSLAEANKYAAGVWKRNHAPQGLLKWVERFHAWRR